eukprot:1349075-Rhodomonas_salina.1
MTSFTRVACSGLGTAARFSDRVCAPVWFDVFVDIYFLIDLALHFFTGIYIAVRATRCRLRASAALQAAPHAANRARPDWRIACHAGKVRGRLAR